MDVVLRLPTGAEDMLLLESAPGLGLALALLERLVVRLDGVPIEWTALAPTDIDALLLALRRHVLGDTIRTDVTCTCGSRVDIAFSISSYLTHHAPQPLEGLAQDADG